MAPTTELDVAGYFFFSRHLPSVMGHSCIEVYFEPRVAEIDIGTHRYTFLDVFLCVKLIYDVKNDFRVH